MRVYTRHWPLVQPDRRKSMTLLTVNPKPIITEQTQKAEGTVGGQVSFAIDGYFDSVEWFMKRLGEVEYRSVAIGSAWTL